MRYFKRKTSTFISYPDICVCQYCLENEVDVCDGCVSIWVTDAIEWAYIDDGRMLCEECSEAETYDEDSD